MKARPLVALFLFAAVVATGWMAWQLRSSAPAQEYMGPPRASYTLDDFQVVFLDEFGSESFTARGPLLARDPYTGQLTIDQPVFSVPAENGAWVARAEDGWVNERGDELRLTREVRVDGPPMPGKGALRIETEELTLFPKTQRATSQREVYVTFGNSILRGRELDADLAARRIQLAEVRSRHVPIRR